MAFVVKTVILIGRILNNEPLFFPEFQHISIKGYHEAGSVF